MKKAASWDRGKTPTERRKCRANKRYDDIHMYVLLHDKLVSLGPWKQELTLLSNWEQGKPHYSRVYSWTSRHYQISSSVKLYVQSAGQPRKRIIRRKNVSKLRKGQQPDTDT
eukprot:scpid100491/ scgid35271/ 